MQHNEPLDLTNIEAFNGLKENITQDDIDHGVVCDSEKCALARALWNMFPGCKVFIEDFIEVSNKSSENYLEIAFSDELSEWINNFDVKKFVEPIALILNTNPDEDPPITLNIDSENTNDQQKET